MVSAVRRCASMLPPFANTSQPAFWQARPDPPLGQLVEVTTHKFGSNLAK